MYTNPQYFSDELHVSLSRGEIICSYDIKTFLLWHTLQITKKYSKWFLLYLCTHCEALLNFNIYKSFFKVDI